MEENANVPTNTTVQPAPENPPAQTGATPPQAATVDVDAIISKAQTKAEEAAQKKMEGVFKSMLEQQGFDASAIAKMTEEWKSKQVTPESQIKELTGQLEGEKAKREAMEMRFTAIEKGVPAKLADKYVKLAGAYMDGEKADFGAALDAALADFPVAKDAPPSYAAGTGTAQMLDETDEILKRAEKYKKRS